VRRELLLNIHWFIGITVEVRLVGYHSNVQP
jgi:hypothetical protein